MRVMMLTRLVDENDPRVGFAHGWVKELAARVDHLDVICQERGVTDLPANVSLVSAGKEQGAGRIEQLVAFQRAIWPRMLKADVVFGHMIPRYTLVAVSAAKAFGVPIVQWYTHGHVGLELRLVHTLARRVVTASPESFRLPSRKAQVLGHGIDFNRFVPVSAGGQPPSDRVVLSVGRLSPVKDLETLIDAAELLLERLGFDDVRFVVAGQEPPEARGYRAALEKRITTLGLGDRIQLAGAIPHTKVVSFYQSGSVMVSLSRTGSLDKAVLEAMGCGLPVVATGRVYAPLLGDAEQHLRPREGDPADVADKLAVLLARPSQERKVLGQSLRARAVQEHSLEGLMGKLVTVFGEVAS
jgi:glycosyltransferase involved in cell wall biosynthesis